jgi:hypothetical protein
VNDPQAPPDPERLDDALESAFGGEPGERRAVVRAARDLADSGQFRADRGDRLDVEGILEELRDAPDGGPADRWNWWMGALDVAYGGYADFGVDRYRTE